MNTIRCTFWGRLDQGKGADLMIDVLPQFLSQSNLHDREFHIFGTGYYQDQLYQLSLSYPQIIIHGRADRDHINNIAQKSHYCLCPSTILESFGMSALEGSKLGLPVIGPNKGGLQQFLIQDLQGLWDNEEESIKGLLSALSFLDLRHDDTYHQRNNQTLEIASRYSTTIRLSTIKQLIGS